MPRCVGLHGARNALRGAPLRPLSILRSHSRSSSVGRSRRGARAWDAPARPSRAATPIPSERNGAPRRPDMPTVPRPGRPWSGIPAPRDTPGSSNSRRMAGLYRGDGRHGTRDGHRGTEQTPAPAVPGATRGVPGATRGVPGASWRRAGCMGGKQSEAFAWVWCRSGVAGRRSFVGLGGYGTAKLARYVSPQAAYSDASDVSLVGSKSFLFKLQKVEVGRAGCLDLGGLHQHRAKHHLVERWEGLHQEKAKRLLDDLFARLNHNDGLSKGHPLRGDVQGSSGTCCDVSIGGNGFSRCRSLGESASGTPAVSFRSSERMWRFA
jgi:hypothetical protein